MRGYKCRHTLGYGTGMRKTTTPETLKGLKEAGCRHADHWRKQLSAKE